MARLIVREVNRRLPVKIQEQAFVAGCMLADYSLVTLKHQHLPCRSLEWVKENISLLSAIEADFDVFDDNYLVAYHLGTVVHYVCDFFCWAHSGETFGNTREHLQYEDFLDNYRYSHAEEFSSREWLPDLVAMRSADEINEHLDHHVKAYRQGGQSVRRDLELAISHSIRVLYSLAAIRLRQTEQAAALDALEAERVRPVYANQVTAD